MPSQSVILPYVWSRSCSSCSVVVIARFPLPALGSSTQRAAKAERKQHSLWKHRNLTLGIPTMIAYLLAEIGVANLFVNFVSQPNIAAVNP